MNIKKSETYKIKCALGKIIRTTKEYWQYISKVKHADLENKIEEVLKTLSKPNEIRQGHENEIYIYYRKYQTQWICVVTRVLNGDGFIITAYLTSKNKRKGKKIWTR